MNEVGFKVIKSNRTIDMIEVLLCACKENRHILYMTVVLGQLFYDLRV